MTKRNPIVLARKIEGQIHLIRGLKVMMDSDLADLYGVTTSNLNKAVQRNRERFPADFLFQLTREEHADLRFQIGISKPHGGRRYLPYAFTQEGIAMLSSVLRSRRAVAVNIEIMRAFVRLRGLLATHGEMARKLAQLEKKFGSHDRKIKVIFQILKQLITPPQPPRRQIGFHAEKEA